MTSPTLSRDVTDCVFVARDYDALCEHVADRIATLIHTKPNAVLGLATGSTPLGVYARLAQRHAENGLDFSGVTCFNLDEYYPMAADAPQSYHRFMQTYLFGQINCRRWFVPQGRPRPEDEIAQDCQSYERRIREAGGIDLQLLGIGRTGHIGFNEPGSSADSRTRLVTLDKITRQDAAAAFGGLRNVPRQAISMGIGTIFEAHEIITMASGAAKAEIVRAAWVSPIIDKVPASLIRTHPNVRLCLDEGAASLLP